MEETSHMARPTRDLDKSSSIGDGGTSAFFNMMEQFDRMGVRAHFQFDGLISGDP